MSVEEHKNKAKDSIKCKVITVSDTRSEETDKSGSLVVQMLQDRGNHEIDYDIVEDSQLAIQESVEKGIADQSVEAIILTGGTGIAFRDVTIETVEPLLEKKMPGFGEIFRMLSYTEDIGSAAILSRAIAGTIRKTVIFSIPGSSGAVKLAMEKLIIPELGHTVFEARK